MVNGVLGLHGDTAVKLVAMGQKPEHEAADVHFRKELDHLALVLLSKILLVWKPLVHVIKALSFFIILIQNNFSFLA